MENATSTKSSSAPLVQGYKPMQNNFGKPLFTEGKSIGGLEGRTASEKLSDFAKKTGLYKLAKTDVYQILDDYLEDYEDNPPKDKEGDEEDAWEHFLRNKFKKYHIPGVDTTRFDTTRPSPRRQRKNYSAGNKGVYERVADFLQEQGAGYGKGAMIFSNGEHYGSAEDLRGADRLLQRYEAFVNSSVGKQLFKDLGGEPKFDGYAFMELGKGVLGAMVYVDGKQILAINKQYAAALEGTALETYVFAHEAVHGLGELSEYRTDKKLYDSFSKSAAKTNGTQQKVYQGLADIGRQYTAGRSAAPYSGKSEGRAA
ncbi:hypothetical protein KY326_03995 [Candidatus Woesearchaeota archaeon]|nr:hypothetical protein [Candidatus Woesearchaeota archaeon]